MGKTKSFDVLKLAKPDKERQARDAERAPDDQRTWFTLSGAVLAPTIARILQVLEGHDQAVELVGSLADGVDPFEAAKRLTRDAKRLKAADYAAAMVPRSEFADGDPAIAGRAAAVELARAWFTRAIKIAVGGPVGIHIAKCDEWRL